MSDREVWKGKQIRLGVGVWSDLAEQTVTL